jgi:hypothetical protein
MFRQVIGLLFVSLIFAGGMREAHSEAQSEVLCQGSFSNMIEQIDHEVPDFEIGVLLFNSKSFINIWNSSYCFVNDAIKLLENSNLSDRRKLIVSYSMQSLPLGSLVYYYKAALHLRVLNKINQRVFIQTVFPGYDWNTLLATNYQDPGVRELIFEIMRSNILPDESNSFDKRYLGQLIEGDINKYVDQLRRDGELRQNK